MISLRYSFSAGLELTEQGLGSWLIDFGLILKGRLKAVSSSSPGGVLGKASALAVD
jgi:hypothetical protein